MPGSVPFRQLIGRIYRQAFSWRTARVFCAVWFTLTSIGLPVSLSQMGGASCAQNSKSQCRCSLTKRLSGACCCSREAQAKLAKSCCSVKKSAPKLSQAEAACCASKSTVVVTPPKVELSIARCDCGSDSPESVSLTQEPRLLVTASFISLSDTTVAFIALPADRVESALLQPPVPPPKIVL